MPEYIIAYLGEPRPESPKEGANQMAEWQAWVQDLGDAVVNPGTPLKNSRTVTSEGVSETSRSSRISGFSIVKADSLDAALEMARACPFVRVGTLEVAETMQLPG